VSGSIDTDLSGFLVAHICIQNRQRSAHRHIYCDDYSCHHFDICMYYNVPCILNAADVGARLVLQDFWLLGQALGLVIHHRTEVLLSSCSWVNCLHGLLALSWL
jgi:hypothetical protein